MKDSAKGRVLTLASARLAGVIFGGAGMLLLATNRLPPGIGAALVVFGFAWSLVIPLVLRRRWRRDDGR